MLHELAVRDLGVIGELTLVLQPGMTAVTGETGAGKTLVVEAIELLMGGRADPGMVRHGADEATVEGRFVLDGDEVVLRRVIPREGRSRAYVDGHLATAGSLSTRGTDLVDLYGQHDHQSLLAPAVQRDALDRYAGIDLAPLEAARLSVRAIDERLAELGGDERGRAREIDLLRFQVDELVAADLDDPEEDAVLEAEEDLLADAQAHQDAAALASRALDVDDGATASLAEAIAALDGRRPFETQVGRLRDVAAELADVATEVRSAGEAIVQDPERQAAVRERRRLLHDLQRKYGESLAEVIEFRDQASRRLLELEDHDRLAAELDRERAAAVAAVEQAEHLVGEARRAAAPRLAGATEQHLHDLGMAKAGIEISVGDDPGDDVRFLLAANPGAPPAPLTKVASGGELARSMLALRLVLTEAPETLVFDEVDAGIGGSAATAVAESLARLGRRHQVMCVTHLAQVAAMADTQIMVSKRVAKNITTATARSVEGDERIDEIARMLSGERAGESARLHAADLLADRLRLA